MSLITPSFDEQTAQVVQVLCSISAFVTGSCGTYAPDTGITFDNLLASLQLNFPTAAWTTQILTNILTAGRERGRFAAADIRDNLGVLNTFYFLNLNMLLNAQPQNQKYKPLCGAIWPCVQTQHIRPNV